MTKRYRVSWRESYEMTGIIEAADYEEAIVKGKDLIDDTPTLEFLDEWHKEGEGAMPHCDMGDVRVEVEWVDGGPFWCVPLSKDEQKDTKKDTDQPMSQDVADMMSHAVMANGIKLLVHRLPAMDPGKLRIAALSASTLLESGVVVLGSELADNHERAIVVVVVSADLCLAKRAHAGEIANRLRPLGAAGGGGTKEMAQLGLPAELLDEVLELAIEVTILPEKHLPPVDVPEIMKQLDRLSLKDPPHVVPIYGAKIKR